MPIVLVTTLFLGSPGLADEDFSKGTDNWFDWDNATGDWGGARTSLENEGVTLSLNYTGDFLGNPTGGLSQGFKQASGLYGSVELDFEKIAGISGFSLFAAGAYQFGKDLSGEDIGNVFGVAQIFNGDAVRLSQVYLLKSFADDKFEIALGRLATGDDFATIDSFGYYVSSGVNGNPASLGTNFPSFTASPFAAWGARATVNPTDNFYVSAGAYNADPDVQDDDENGVDFSFDPSDGVLGLVEVGYTINQDSKSSGLPGRYVLGAIYDSSDYEKFSDPNVNEDGNYGFYGIAEQMVYREGAAGSDEGLTAWASVTFSPEDDINTLPVGVFAGANYKGLIDGRDDDVTAFGVYYGLFSDDLPGQNSEVVFELNYRVQVAPSTYITPDIQYVLNPNGGGIQDALVLGFEASIDF